MRGLPVIGAALVLAGVYVGVTRAQAQTVHVGSIVIMMGYEDPSLYGAKRAAIVSEGPFTCPAGHPHEGGECVTLTYFIRYPGDFENLDTVQCGAPGGCGGVDLSNYGVRSGSDRRIAVWHDPTGKEHRSWHVWGEAEGEQ